jgi:hypothetical protein
MLEFGLSFIIATPIWTFGRGYWPYGRLRRPWCAGLISSDMIYSNRRLGSAHQFSKNPIYFSINGYIWRHITPWWLSPRGWLCFHGLTIRFSSIYRSICNNGCESDPSRSLELSRVLSYRKKQFRMTGWTIWIWRHRWFLCIEASNRKQSIAAWAGGICMDYIYHIISMMMWSFLEVPSHCRDPSEVHRK